MRLASVTAKSFGAIVGQTLALDDGLTIVYGDNGAGKSTWHAALYAALCGFPAQALSDFDREFEAQRAPEDGEWAVGADIITGDDHIEVVQDLRTHHATLWRGGTPSGRSETIDFSRQLRLDRYSYAATSLIEQEETVPLRGRLFNVASAFVRDTEAEAALRELHERATYLGAPDSGGRLDRAREHYDAAREQAHDLIRRQKLKAEAEEELRVARATEARLRRQVRLGEAAEAKAVIRDIKRRIRALEMVDEQTPATAFSPWDPPPPSAELRHQRVAAAERNLAAVDAEYERLAVPVYVAPVPSPEVGAEFEPDPEPPTEDIPVVVPVVEPVAPPAAVPTAAHRESSMVLPLAIAVVLALVGITLGLFGQLVVAGVLIAAAIVIVAALAIRERPGAVSSFAASSAGSGAAPVTDRPISPIPNGFSTAAPATGSPTPYGSTSAPGRPATGSPAPFGTAGTFGPINTGPVTAADLDTGSPIPYGTASTLTRPAPTDAMPVHSGPMVEVLPTVGSPEELHRAQQAVDHALLQLELALAAVPFPLGHDGVRAAYESYEDERQRQAAEKASRQTALRNLERQLAHAEETARQLALEFDHNEIESVWPMLANVEDADRLGRNQLQLNREEHIRAEGAIGPLAERVDQITDEIAQALRGRDPIALRDEAARQLHRLQALRTVLDDAADALKRARTQALRDVSEAINQNLAESLPGVIDIRDMRVTLDPELNVRVRERARGTNTWGPGSNSTRRLAQLFARVALGSFIARQVSSGGGGGERGPLLIDELAADANGTRQHRTLDWLLGLAGTRQVVVFTADPNTLKWAKRRRSTESRLHLLWLDGVASTPEPYDDQDAASGLFRRQQRPAVSRKRRASHS